MAGLNIFHSLLVALLVGLFILATSVSGDALKKTTLLAPSPVAHAALNITSTVRQELIDDKTKKPTTRATSETTPTTKPDVRIRILLASNNPNDQGISQMDQSEEIVRDLTAEEAERKIKRSNRLNMGITCGILGGAAFLGALGAWRHGRRRKKSSKVCTQQALRQQILETRKAVWNLFKAQKGRAFGRDGPFSQRQKSRFPLEMRSPYLRYLLSPKRKPENSSFCIECCGCEDGSSSTRESECIETNDNGKYGTSGSSCSGPYESRLSPVFRREAVKTV